MSELRQDIRGRLNPAPSELPNLSHIPLTAYENVYEPAEDTYLFVDTLAQEEAFLKALRPSICLEVGGGSGCVTAKLSQIVPDSFFFVTDINPHSADVCQSTMWNNGVCCRSDVVLSDLASGLISRLQSLVDILLFNPPYVVTPSEEINESLISRAWAGGEHGREVLDRLLPDVPKLLSKGGVFYLVAIEENKPAEICNLLLKLGMRSANILTRRTAFNEKLMIIKATK